MARRLFFGLAIASAAVAVVLVGIGLWTGFDRLGAGGTSGYTLAGLGTLVLAGAFAFVALRVKPRS